MNNELTINIPSKSTQEFYGVLAVLVIADAHTLIVTKHQLEFCGLLIQNLLENNVLAAMWIAEHAMPKPMERSNVANMPKRMNGEWVIAANGTAVAINKQ